MKPFAKLLLGLTLIATSSVLPARVGSAQTITTATLSGLVSDAQGGVLPGVTVVAVHQPTGTRYQTVSGTDGRFTILNMRVGGPYTVTESLNGFQDQQQNGLTLHLGEDRALTVTLRLASVSEHVEVKAASPLIDTTQAGTASSVSGHVLQSLPTISRNLFDFVRTSPYFNPIASNSDPNSISVAGQNNRYNSIEIDGALDNDLFGLAASGTPGGQVNTQPISLDAVQELQLVVSPYDVRQGNFTGGGINAITKSGSNAFHGDGYYYGRNQNLVGSGVSHTSVGTFSDKQFGVSLGGPLKTNRAFFFGNVDLGRENNPSGYSITGSGQPFGHQADAQQFLDILKSEYNYNPGGLGEFTRPTNNNKVFVRTDFNLGHSQLTVRNNYINASAALGGPSSTRYIFPTSFYTIKDKQNSAVVQLNSAIGDSSFNQFRLTYQTISDHRAGPDQFPQVTVYLPDNTSLRAGTEEYSTANALDQHIMGLTDNYTLVKGAHTITVGTHNEFFKFNNLFIRDNFGVYTFDSLALFAQGLAQSFSYSFSNTSNPQQAATFAVHQFGFYAGDKWQANHRLTLTYGLRADIPQFPDTPTANPITVTDFGYRTNVAPHGVLWSPRIGFNYDLSADATQQIRGGLGMFSGNTPYVWLSNQYSNTGIEFTRLQVYYNANNRIPFVANPHGQPTSLGSASSNEIDLVDPNYKFPELLRGNLAYDRQLGALGEVTFEGLFSKTIHDIKYENLNLVQSGTAPDGRPVYSPKISSLSNVILLTNTNQGYSWSLSAKLDRPFRNGLYFSGSYLYGQAKSIMDGTSSQAVSNWDGVYVPGNPNNPPLATSDFSIGSKVVLTGSYNFPLGGGTRATASVFYSGQSGRPYSVAVYGDINGDHQNYNDLLFVPNNPNQIEVVGGTYQQLQNYISSNACISKYAGQIVPRNACRAPWLNTMDFRFSVSLPSIHRTHIELVANVLNLINLVDSSAGLLQYASYNELTNIRYRGVDPATGKMIYDISGLTSPTFKPFTLNDLASRWQAQFGLRVSF